MASLQELPPELIATITANLDFGSHMNLMLTSKTLFSKVRAVQPTRREEWLEFNLDFEKHVPPRRVLPILTCTSCVKFHPRTMFSDAQRKKGNRRRFCIETGITPYGFYSFGRTFLVGGVAMFACARCCKALPEAKEASYDSNLGLKLRLCKRCWRVVEKSYLVRTPCC